MKKKEILSKGRQDLLNAFGKRMKTLRNQKGRKFSQEKLGEASGLHRNYISDAERGTRNVSLVAILKIINGLDSSISEFFAVGFDNIDTSNLYDTFSVE
ncbi:MULTISPECIES: helix-turn-helix domain-containing protein [Spiroplasma]|uniref:helix-turn-helix domain-containing protein n=1 Tax=Spiroplasma TaxID=2132 RepID=UPI00120DAC7E|nr:MULTISPECIES: helix-turn-helix transcriptional regulator [Spiroplasma]MBP1525267.1 helix-turn-helix transcriptional regulator [Spiroplasma ixodetis]TLF27234.1 MAG: helix-turn-helix transcriptional regulator [Spiroplasma sp. WSS]MBP1526680.1 helix-turn-helix transcriptional regulator [Spiroplasma ixodetis]MBP1527964.1 helix-turn-helix transcriptional regulator [Spiroplasma ixodetis]WJG70831.1 XRE family transcriptional regulator [Spiroplasma ixodetis Y32]